MLPLTGTGIISSHRNRLRLLFSAASTELDQANMVMLQTYVLPNQCAARALQAICCILLLNQPNQLVR